MIDMNPMKNFLYVLFLLFTFSADAQEAPGAVLANNVFWVKADVGVTFASSDVAEWTDQSNGGNDAFQTMPAFRPSYNSSLFNYNPGVHFDGDNENLKMNNLVGAASKNLNVFVVGTNEQGGDSWHAMLVGQSNSTWLNGGYGICGLDGGAYEFGFWVDSYNSHAVAPIVKNASTLLEGKYNGSQIEFFQNAYLEGTAPYSGVIGDVGTTYLGGGIGTDYNHKGYIAEVAIYDTSLSVLDRNKVSSYLAIKYGLTLDKNGVSNQYIMSDGQPIYASENAYWNDIIGIVRDDNGTLLQKQSHLENDSVRIYLKTIKKRNVSNTGVFSADKQAVVMGSNTGGLYATEATLSDKPSGVFRLLDRTWQIKNSNFDGTFSLDVLFDECAFVNPISTADMRLLVDTDGDFSDAQTFGSMQGITFMRTGNLVSIVGIDNAHIPKNSTVYFTLGSLTNPIVTMPYFMELCPGQSMDINGTTYDASNASGLETLVSSSGCDSLVNINLTFGAGVGTNFSQVLCMGEEVSINGTVYDVANPTGTEILTSLAGCDSIVNVQLTFFESAVTNITQSLCSGETIEINGTIYDENNLTGIETLTNAVGCDSTVHISLSIINGVSVPYDTTICVGTSLVIEGQVFDENNLSGTLVYSSLSGCDSIVQIHLSFYEEMPDVLDDVYTIVLPKSTSLSIVENDGLPAHWAIRIVSTNHFDYWDLNEAGELLVYGDRATSGEELIVTYEVCNKFCNSLCSSGQVIVYFEFSEPDPETIVSEILTLNNDGKNDFLFFKGINLSNNEGITIFNRWGDLVFSEFPYKNAWGGKNKKEEDLPTGTYYYVLYLNRSEGKSILGDVLLIR